MNIYFERKYRFISIDFGEKNIGIAVSNGQLIRPFLNLNYPFLRYDILKERINKIINDINPEFIFIGFLLVVLVISLFKLFSPIYINLLYRVIVLFLILAILRNWVPISTFYLI